MPGSGGSTVANPAPELASHMRTEWLSALMTLGASSPGQEHPKPEPGNVTCAWATYVQRPCQQQAAKCPSHHRPQQIWTSLPLSELPA